MADLFIKQLADTAHQVRISAGINPEVLRHLRCIHPGEMIRLILVQHAPDTGFGKTHVNREIRHNVPGTVLLMHILRSDLSTQMLYICHAGKNDRLEGFYS